MSEQDRKHQMDRRTFMKVLGTAGATAAFMSVTQPAALGEAFFQPPAGSNGAPLGLSAQPGDVLAAQPKEKLASIYTGMVRSRKWETTMKDLFVGGKDGLYGAFHPYVGEEAIANGIMGVLNKDDYIASTHRGHGHLIAKGGDLNKMAAEIFFRQGGYNQGFGGSMHITDLSLGILGMNGIVGAAFYPAAGAAYAAKLRGTKQVAVGFGGDGASNSVYFFSAVRNAYNYRLPVIFVIENNYWQIAIPMITNVINGMASTYTKGLPVPSITVDGNDVAAVFAAASEAVDRARAGEGPTVIEGMTYRWYDHAGFAGAKVGVDGAFGLPYRSDDDVRMWMTRDPIPRYKTFLLGRKLFTADELTAIENEAQKAVDAAVEFARNSPKTNPSDGVKNVYAKGAVKPTQFLNAAAPVAYNVNPDTPVFGQHLPLIT
ncbi:MAG: thiamine pyrophosphate-dependent enzyme [Chloroflexi bacterium]|nr:thiamine pyrophosphate-dependent enzyme [Chloroflexota bacterium]